MKIAERKFCCIIIIFCNHKWIYSVSTTVQAWESNQIRYIFLVFHSIRCHFQCVILIQRKRFAFTRKKNLINWFLKKNIYPSSGCVTVFFSNISMIVNITWHFIRTCLLLFNDIFIFVKLFRTVQIIQLKYSLLTRK